MDEHAIKKDGNKPSFFIQGKPRMILTYIFLIPVIPAVVVSFSSS